jgi:hypothetical protein
VPDGLLDQGETATLVSSRLSPMLGPRPPNVEIDGQRDEELDTSMAEAPLSLNSDKHKHEITTPNTHLFDLPPQAGQPGAARQPANTLFLGEYRDILEQVTGGQVQAQNAQHPQAYSELPPIIGGLGPVQNAQYLQAYSPQAEPPPAYQQHHRPRARDDSPPVQSRSRLPESSTQDAITKSKVGEKMASSQLQPPLEPIENNQQDLRSYHNVETEEARTLAGIMYPRVPPPQSLPALVPPRRTYRAPEMEFLSEGETSVKASEREAPDLPIPDPFVIHPPALHPVQLRYVNQLYVASLTSTVSTAKGIVTTIYQIHRRHSWSAKTRNCLASSQAPLPSTRRALS